MLPFLSEKQQAVQGPFKMSELNRFIKHPRKPRLFIGLFYVLFFNLGIWGLPLDARAQSPDNSKGDTVDLPYRYFVPKPLIQDKKKFSDSDLVSITQSGAVTKLIVFLHGSGERGSDNESQLIHGQPFFEKLAQDNKALVLVPQCPKEKSWHKGYSTIRKGKKNYHYPKKILPNDVLDALEELIDYLSKGLKIPTKNIALGGLSMGGMGTLELLRRRPGYYSRAFVICGGAHPIVARQIGPTPTWFFHGDRDPVVLPKYAKKLFKRLKTRGYESKMTIYPNVEHDSWDLAFKESELISWLNQ